MKKNSYLAFLIFAGDIAIFYAALVATLIFRYGRDGFFEWWELHKIPFTILFLIWGIVFYIAGLYDKRFLKADTELQSLVARTMLAAAIIGIGLFYSIPYFIIAPKTNLLIHIAVSAVLIVGWRYLLSKTLAASAKIRVIFFGHSKELHDLMDVISSNPQFGYEPVCVVLTDQEKEPHPVIVPVVYFDHNLARLVKKYDAALVVAASDIKKDESIVRMLYQILPLGVSFRDFPTFYEHIIGKIPVSLIGEAWFIENIAQLKDPVTDYVKRIIDVILAALAGLIAIILFPIIAVLIKLETSGPIFLKQIRTGKNGVPFTLIKFRSMIALGPGGVAETVSPVWAQEIDSRVTKFGRFLRTTHIDELPQAWNILTGELSVVGPRPERPEFVGHLEKVIPHYAMRQLIKPGITGWAQINMPGMYAGSVEDSLEKLQYDLYYIKHKSIMMDIAIILKTILLTLKRVGR